MKDMREIKFRVWNGTEMVYDITVGKFGVFYVNPSNNGLDPKDSASLTPFTTKYHEGTPVMQFTGLIDKSGNEIWEGDIISVGNGSINGQVMIDDPYEVKYNVKKGFLMCMFCWNHDGSSNMDSTHYCEVIGNAYKHAHLLKQDKVTP